MKKKIALLLALIMTISLMPVTIFAKSNNRMSNSISTVRNESVFYVKSADPANSLTGGVSGSETWSSWKRIYDKDISRRKAISARFEASYLVMALEDSLNSGSAFRLTLSNAIWAFAVTADTTVSSGAVVALVDTEKGYTLDADYLGYTYDPTNVSTADKAISGDIGYSVRISTGNQSNATVTFTGKGNYTNGTLRIPMTMYVASNNVEVTVTVGDNNSAFTSGEYAVVSTASGSTSNSFASIRSGRETITLDTLIMKETRIGALTKGAMEIVAPSGYRFVNNPSSWTFNYEAGLGLKSDGTKTSPKVEYREFYEGESYVLLFTDIGDSAQSSNRIPGSIEISGIKIEPIDYDDVVIDRDLFITLNKYVVGNNVSGYRNQATGASVATVSSTDELGIKVEQVLAAKSVDWTVTLTSEGTASLVAGRLDDTKGRYDSTTGMHRSSYFVFEEQEVGAWNSARTTTFKLPEGVKILGIEFDYTTNVYTNSGYTSLLKDAYKPAEIRAGLASTTSSSSYTDSTGCITFKGNEFSLKNLYVNADASTNDGKAKIRLRLELSVSPDYADDTTVELTVSGTAIPEDISKVAIAKVRQPITVEAKTTQVEIGYQSFNVSDVTITENIAGAIRRLVDQTGTIKIALTDYYSSSSNDDLKFATIKDSQVKVTAGDLKAVLNDVSNGVISLNVERASTTASTIVISGLSVRINRNVPYGNYDLLVYGDSVFANYWKDENGDVPATTTSTTGVIQNSNGSYNLRSNLTGFGFANENGYVAKDYIKVATAGAGDLTTTINSQIKLYPGSTTIHVDGKTVQLQEAPFIDNATGTTYVPVRFVSEALGMLVAWNDITRTATITTDGYTVLLSYDNSTIIINGMPSSMTNQLGVSVAPFEKGDRMYIPIRAFFEAFGCTVGWDGATNTATIN